MQNKVIIPIIVLVLSFIFGFFAYQYFWLPRKVINEVVDVTPTEEMTQEEETIQEEDEEILQEKKVVEKLTGFIEGSLGYPSEFIPEDMVICAENLDTKKLYCTENHIQDNKYTHGLGYNIEVPAGDYFVYAYLKETPAYSENYKAYYSEFVTCGSSVECKSHAPIKVTVDANTTKSNIDPQDWYDF